MTSTQARIKLTHAIIWLGSEDIVHAGWACAGITLAIRKLQAARNTFYSNSSHRSNRCNRCLTIAAIAKKGGAE